MTEASNSLSDCSVGTDDFSDGGYIAIPCANSDNERPRTLSEALPVGVSETGATQRRLVFSSHTERTVWISVQCMHVAPCMCVSASACQLSILHRTEPGVDRLKQTHILVSHALHTDPLV